MLKLAVNHDQQPPMLRVDYSEGTFLTGSLHNALSFIARLLNQPLAGVTAFAAAEAGFTIRRYHAG